jgi:hypothetical protein
MVIDCGVKIAVAASLLATTALMLITCLLIID